MLELFSRKPDSIQLKEDSDLSPIPVDEEISSLSAILLDEEYYPFIHAGRRDIGGLSVLSPEYLIPLKARAWLNLSAEFNSGIAVDEKNIRKHKNDIIRLFQLLTIHTRIDLPKTIQKDMQQFMHQFQKDVPDLKMLGLKHIGFSELLAHLAQIYSVSLE